MTDDHSNPDCPIKLAHGTTTLAFRFQGGIVSFPWVLLAGFALHGSLIGIDRCYGFESFCGRLDCQSDGQEGDSGFAVESGRGQADG